MIEMRFINHKTGVVTEDVQGITDILLSEFTDKQKTEFYRVSDERREELKNHIEDYFNWVNYHSPCSERISAG